MLKIELTNDEAQAIANLANEGMKAVGGPAAANTFLVLVNKINAAMKAADQEAAKKETE